MLSPPLGTCRPSPLAASALRGAEKMRRIHSSSGPSLGGDRLSSLLRRMRRRSPFCLPEPAAPSFRSQASAAAYAWPAAPSSPRGATALGSVSCYFSPLLLPASVSGSGRRVAFFSHATLAASSCLLKRTGEMRKAQTCAFSTGSGGSQVVLSKERHNQLLMAEITEFAMRPCRPLTLQEIAYLKGPHMPPHAFPSGSTPDRSVLPAPSPESVLPASALPAAVEGSEAAGEDNSVELFLSVELPVRFASRIKQIEAVPLFNQEQLIMQVRQLYVESFKQLRMCTWTSKEEFAKLLKNLKRRHAPIAPLLVTGMRNLKRRWPHIFTDGFVDDFLDSFFLSRIGTEMLTSAYLSPKGIVDSECDPMQVIKKAAGDAERLCHYHYGCCPRVMIWNHERARFACVPQYLYYILFELFKNAMRATVERFGGKGVHRWHSCASAGDASPRGPRAQRVQSASSQQPASATAAGKEDETNGWAPRRSAGTWHSSDSLSGAEECEYDGSCVFFGRPPHYETRITETDTKLPPIQIVVSGDDRVIAIKMSDQGGGVGQESIAKIWSYMYTTARPVEIGVSQPPTTLAAPPPHETPFSPPTVGSLDAAPPTIPGAAVVSSPSGADSSGPRDPAPGPAGFPRALGSTTAVGRDGRPGALADDSVWAQWSSRPSCATAGREATPAGPPGAAPPSSGMRQPLAAGAEARDVRSAAEESRAALDGPAGGSDGPGDRTQGPAAPPTGSGSMGQSTPQVSPLAGFGCGLPLSRLYASYLGGRLEILSLPFHGSDAYLYLNRIGDKERMPPDSFPHVGPRASRGPLRSREELDLLGLPRD